MKLFTLLQALDTLQTNAPSLDCEVDGVHNDTRRMKPGDMFVAIPGTDTDGHCYIQDAMKIGASMVVTERPLDPAVPHVVVPDARVALAQLAACMHGYPAQKMTMTGVTGTKGKTTVTHIIKGLIEGVTGETVGLIGTNYNLIGRRELSATRTAPTTPDAVTLHGVFAEMVRGGCTHCVMEVSSHALAQSRVLGVPYKAGAFTNLQHDHLDYHRDMEDYFDAKSRLFLQCEQAIINIDDPYGRRLSAQHPSAITISCNPNEKSATFTAKNIQLHPDGVSFDVAICDPKLSIVNCPLSTVHWHTPGAFSVQNALTALACGYALGLPPGEMARALPGVPPVIGRMEPVPVGGRGFHVMIDYAHTPESVENALSAARGFCSGRLVAVFGCGGDRDKTKRSLMGAAAQKAADICYVTSDNPRTEDPEAIIHDILAGMKRGETVRVEPDRREAIRLALEEARAGDVVLLLGKGQETYQEIHGVKYPMDEREIIRELLS